MHSQHSASGDNHNRHRECKVAELEQAKDHFGGMASVASFLRSHWSHAMVSIFGFFLPSLLTFFLGLSTSSLATT